MIQFFLLMIGSCIFLSGGEDAVNPCAVTSETVTCSGGGSYPAEVELRSIKINGSLSEEVTVTAEEDLHISVRLKYTKRARALVTTVFDSGCPDREEYKRFKPPLEISYSAGLDLGNGNVISYSGNGSEWVIPAANLTVTPAILNVSFRVDDAPNCVAQPYAQEAKTFTITVGDGTAPANLNAVVDREHDDIDYSGANRLTDIISDGDHFIVNQGVRIKFTADYADMDGQTPDPSEIVWSTEPESAGSFPKGNAGREVSWQQKAGFVGHFKVISRLNGAQDSQMSFTTFSLDEMRIDMAPNSDLDVVVPSDLINPPDADLGRIAALLSKPGQVGGIHEGIRLRTRTYTSPETALANEAFIPSEASQEAGSGLVIERASFKEVAGKLLFQVRSGNIPGKSNISWEIKRKEHIGRRYTLSQSVNVVGDETPASITLVQLGNEDPGPFDLVMGEELVLIPHGDFQPENLEWDIDMQPSDAALVAPGDGQGLDGHHFRFDVPGRYRIGVSNGGPDAYVTVNVYGINLDIDSDNDNGQAEPGDEDEAEDSAPGKITPVGLIDTDEDGIPDFADGFNLDGMADNNDDYSSGTEWVPVVLELPHPVDPTSAIVKITYSASNPLAVTANGLPPTFTPPAEGKLRLWIKEGDEPRDAHSIIDSGDFIPSGSYPADMLGFDSSEQEIILFLEAVKASESMGDLNLTVELDYNGDGNFDVSDAVTITAISVEIQDTNLYLAVEKKSSFFGTGTPAGGTWQWDVTDNRCFQDCTKIIEPSDGRSVMVRGDADSASLNGVTLTAIYSLHGGKVTNSLKLTVVESVFMEDPNQLFGFDDYSNKETGGPAYKSVAEGKKDTVLLTWRPSPLPDDMHVISADMASLSIASPVSGNAPQTVMLTSHTANPPTTIDVIARPAAKNGPDAGLLKTTVYNDRLRTVAYQLVHEENDDEQIGKVGETGSPMSICVSAGGNTELDTNPNGDDIISGTNILMGPNGICNTMANSTDVINNTVLGRADLENYLNKVFKQACIRWEVTELQAATVNWDIDRNGFLAYNGNAGSDEEMAVRKQADGTYDHNIFLVAPFTQTSPKPNEILLGYGILPGKHVFLDSTVHSHRSASVLNTLAHELGHNLDLKHVNGIKFFTNDRSNLMWDTSLPKEPISLRKFQWDTANARSKQ